MLCGVALVSRNDVICGYAEVCSFLPQYLSAYHLPVHVGLPCGGRL
jgi:hypothetical protein